MGNREEYFISKLARSGITKNIGDDGVLIGDYVYAMDLFCENVHFKRGYFNYYQIAQKAMLVNVSDIVAMGVKPQYALLGISFSDDMRNCDIMELQRGIVDACKRFSIKIIGGDTIKDSKLNIAITMFGRKDRRLISRDDFRAGDVVFFSGNLGSVKKDMLFLYHGLKISPDSKFYTPHVRVNFIYDILPFIHGGMDISDGVFHELNRLSRLNRIKFHIEKNINMRNLASGEEYELLFSVAPKDIRRLRVVAAKNRVKITKLATITKGAQRFYCAPHHA